jgi:hypothetical protein
MSLEMAEAGPLIQSGLPLLELLGLPSVELMLFQFLERFDTLLAYH